MSFLFQCVNGSTSTTIPTDFLGNQLVAKADKQKIKCIDKDRNALLDFKAMIFQDPYGDLSAWGTKNEDVDDDCCNWRGVTCNNQTGHVTELDLGSWRLEEEGIFSGVWRYPDHAMIWWQGNIQEFSSTIGLLKSIDLSSNNLTGQIPNKLTELHGLLALNLSKNALLGEIPHKIGQMKEIQILDLSGNNLSGRLPSTLSQLNFLNYLDVSYNNLSGKIPSSTQLQSFEPSRYIGNAGLCGPPLLTKSCPGDEEPGSEGGGEGDIDELERWFYIGGAIGFAIGFWIVCSALLVNRRGRHTFFHFLDTLEDWVYVKVMVFKAKYRRSPHE